MKKWCSLLVIFIFLSSIVDVNAADSLTGFSFKDVILKVVNSIKNVFSVAPVGGPIEDPNIITPINLRAEVHNSEVTLTWNEGSSIEDVTKPVVTLISPINNEAFFQNQLIQFSCTVSDNQAIDKVELWITDPVNGFHLEQTKRVQEETEDGPISTFRFSKSFAQIGQYAWNCKAYDKNDNNAFGSINDQSPMFAIRQEGEPIFSGSVTGDTDYDTERAGPVVTLNSPIDYPTYDQGTRIEFSCSATSNIQLRKIEFWVKDPTAGFNLDEIRESFPDELRYEARFNRALDQEGGYEWNCKAYDINGNSAFGSVNGQSPGFNIRRREYNLGYKIYRINLDINQVDIIINSRIFFNCRSLSCSYTDRNLEEGNYRYYVLGYVTHNGVEKQSRSSNLVDVAVTSQPPPGGGGGNGGGGSGGGSGGGGSGGGTTSCEEKWLCGGWSACINSQQTRSCVDLNSCKNTVQKIARPFETRSCTTLQQTQEEEFEQEQESQGGELETGAKSVFARQLIGILTLLIIIGAIILIIFRKKIFNKELKAKTDRAKMRDDEHKGVIIAVRSAMQNGFSSEEIKKELIAKGWTKEQINNILKRV